MTDKIDQGKPGTLERSRTGFRSPERDDAVQGSLGDAALVAMLGAVAGHRPDAIRQAVRRHPDGGARVVLHQVQLDPVNVDWTPTGSTISLDLSGELPLMPYDGETNTFYADTHYSQTIWPALLEKAFAAIDTTWTSTRRMTIPDRAYTRLDDGWNVWDTAEALAQLTGARTKVRILHPDTTNLTLRYLLAHQCPVLIHTHPPTTAEPQQQHGIYPGHAYEITSIDPNDLLTLRNPWGFQHATITTTALFDLTGGVITTLAT